MTRQQVKFINAYFIHNFNATKAAEEAGYGSPKQRGHEVRNLPDVAAEIERRLSEHAMSANEVLARMGRQARASIFDVLELEPYTKKPLMNLGYANEQGTGDLVREVSYNERGDMSVKLIDSQAALFQLGRHHKLFTDKTETSNPDALNLLREMLGTDNGNGEGS